MPIIPGNGTVTVQSGDTLWGISKAVLKYEGNANPTNTQIQNKVNEIVKLNNIANPNLIYVGQIFKVSTSSTSSSTGVTSGSKSNAPENVELAIQSGTDQTVFATWTWGKHNETDHYEYEWYYATGDGIWFYGTGGSSEKRLQCTYDPPKNANKVKFIVKPIAKTKKEG